MHLLITHTNFFSDEIYDVVFKMMEESDIFKMEKLTEDCLYPLENIDFLAFHLQVPVLNFQFDAGILKELVLVFGENSITVVRDDEEIDF